MFYILKFYFILVNNLLINTTTTVNVSKDKNFSLGCSPNFDWCATTPAVNMYLFLSLIILTLGIALPLSSINLDILFSKILGCSVKQVCK